jgi:hypothetical protein
MRAVRPARFLSCLLGILFVAPVAPATAQGPGLDVGAVIGPDNWKAAEGLLPPEVLKHYEKGDYRNQIVDYPTGNAHWDAAFEEATKRNATTLDVDDRGTIVSKADGQQLGYYYGIPFPDIDPADPKAGIKVVWNQFLAYWAGGSSYNRTLVTMLTPGGADREIIADGWFQFLDGQAEKYRQENPLNLQSRFLGVALEPADLQGTASLTWRYRDPGKRDSQWAYVPMLRRVRQVSPANRSDGYLGSDISGDDGFFFDGKPEDFTWKLVGKRTALRLVDPNAVKGGIEVKPAPNGGWIALTDLNPPTAGYQVKGWEGISWAPVAPALAKREVWVVEGVPKDKYYLYGKVELWIDAETWDGAWNRKFSWAGELTSNYQSLARINQAAGPESDREWLPVGTMVWACAENVKLNRATLGGMRPYPDAAFYRRQVLNDSIFEPGGLARLGK